MTPKHADGKVHFTDTKLVDTWKAMEVKKKKDKNITKGFPVEFYLWFVQGGNTGDGAFAHVGKEGVLVLIYIIFVIFTFDHHFHCVLSGTRPKR